jgi:hypothetical protein
LNRKSFVLLDAASRADGYVRVDDGIRFAQVRHDWLRDIISQQG